jgi:hypothetical protein
MQITMLYTGENVVPFYGRKLSRQFYRYFKYWQFRKQGAVQKPLRSVRNRNRASAREKERAEKTSLSLCFSALSFCAQDWNLSILGINYLDVMSVKFMSRCKERTSKACWVITFSHVLPVFANINRIPNDVIIFSIFY